MEPRASSIASGDFGLGVYTLWSREVVRFLRQKNRVVGALGTPLVFWFLIGSGVGSSFRTGATGSGDYFSYFFPGMLLLVVLFTAIFSTISVIEDRREGFLQAVLVAPVPRSAVVVAKLLGGMTLSVLQCLLIYFLALPLGLHFSLGSFALLVITLCLLGLALTGLGYLLAWPLDSVQGYHALMNLLLMPLWLLSGALFPPEGSVGWMRLIIHANPLYYGLELLRTALSPGRSGISLWFFGAITLLFTAVVGLAAVVITDRVRVKHP